MKSNKNENIKSNVWILDLSKLVCGYYSTYNLNKPLESFIWPDNVTTHTDFEAKSFENGATVHWYDKDKEIFVCHNEEVMEQINVLLGK